MLSVIVLTYNQESQLRLVLEGYARQTGGRAFEVIVVNDGGRDCAGIVGEYDDRLDVSYTEVSPPSETMRLNKARNAGLRKAKYRRVLLNDGDSIPSANMVDVHAEYYDRAICVQSQRIFLPEQPGIDQVQDLTQLRGKARFEPDRDNFRVALQWPEVHGYSSSFPASVVRAIGGWCERFTGHSGNDSELTQRLSRIGLGMVADCRARSYHIAHRRPYCTPEETERTGKLHRESAQTFSVFRNGQAIDQRGCWQDFAEHFFDASLAGGLVDLLKGQGGAYDFGCGDGRLVKTLSDSLIWIDGYDGNPNTPAMTDGLCKVLDLSRPVNLPPRDWVVSLEVGEHIPRHFEGDFLDNLDRCAKKGVVLSWAVPGQGGRGHVNERPNEEIAASMFARGFSLDREQTARLRELSTLPYFANTLQVFRR